MTRCRREHTTFGVPPCTRAVDVIQTVSGKATHTTCGERCALLLMAEREQWTRPEVDRMLSRLAEGEQRARARRGREAEADAPGTEDPKPKKSKRKI